MFRIEITTDNAAFKPDRGWEIARILRSIHSKLESGATSGKLFDVNGNSVGRFGFD